MSSQSILDSILTRLTIGGAAEPSACFQKAHSDKVMGLFLGVKEAHMTANTIGLLPQF